MEGNEGRRNTRRWLLVSFGMAAAGAFAASLELRGAAMCLGSDAAQWQVRLAQAKLL